MLANEQLNGIVVACQVAAALLKGHHVIHMYVQHLTITSLGVLLLCQIFPLVREHCSVEEQRVLVYQSLREMPLRLLERVLPWVVAYVSDDEAADMVRNMRLAGSEIHCVDVNGSIVGSWLLLSHGSGLEV